MVNDTDLHTLESQRRDVAASLRLVERKRDELRTWLAKLGAQIETARFAELSAEYDVDLYRGAEVIITREELTRQGVSGTGIIDCAKIEDIDDSYLWLRITMRDSISQNTSNRAWPIPTDLVADARRAYLEREASHE